MLARLSQEKLEEYNALWEKLNLLHTDAVAMGVAAILSEARGDGDDVNETEGKVEDSNTESPQPNSVVVPVEPEPGTETGLPHDERRLMSATE